MVSGLFWGRVYFQRIKAVLLLFINALSKTLSFIDIFRKWNSQIPGLRSQVIFKLFMGFTIKGNRMKTHEMTSTLLYKIISHLHAEFFFEMYPVFKPEFFFLRIPAPHTNTRYHIQSLEAKIYNYFQNSFYIIRLPFASVKMKLIIDIWFVHL